MSLLYLFFVGFSTQIPKNQFFSSVKKARVNSIKSNSIINTSPYEKPSIKNCAVSVVQTVLLAPVTHVVVAVCIESKLLLWKYARKAKA